MKVKELKKLLEDIPDNYLVILSKDSEGNGYSPLYTVDVARFNTKHQELEEVGKTNSVVLWP